MHSPHLSNTNCRRFQCTFNHLSIVIYTMRVQHCYLTKTKERLIKSQIAADVNSV